MACALPSPSCFRASAFTSARVAYLVLLVVPDRVQTGATGAIGLSVQTPNLSAKGNVSPMTGSIRSICQGPTAPAQNETVIGRATIIGL